MSGFLLDTNVISELIRRQPSPRVKAWIEQTEEDLLHLSVLTLGELRKGAVKVQDPARRVMLETWIDGYLVLRFAGHMIPIDRAVADRWGRIAAQAGRPLPVIDALLAATALHHDMTLVTRNTSDVEATGVSVFNPWN